MGNIVRENIKFKRGRDVKQSLGIGIEDSLDDLFDEWYLEGIHPFQQERLDNGALQFYLFIEQKPFMLKRAKDIIKDWADKHGYQFDWRVGTTRLPKNIPWNKHLEGKMGNLVDITFTNK